MKRNCPLNVNDILYLREVVKPEPPTQEKTPANSAPKGYQPTVGRKLFMIGLCILGLIIVWTYFLRSQ